MKNDVKIEMNIIVKDEEPIYRPPRRFSVWERNLVNEQIEQRLSQGIIRPSISEYASPSIVLVGKKNGSRLCVDYCENNSIICKERYPLLLMDDLFDSLQEARVFSTLDLENGFFYVPVAENSRKHTFCDVLDGQYEFLKVPFGLCYSPAVCQRYINWVFSDLMKESVLLVY